jgi:Na+/pantothenate symporter
MTETPFITTLTFLLYVAGVFILAFLSHRVLGRREFLSEYFLGSRGLRSWSLAFAFAATATSAGSYVGFPALIYTYGWVLALWISSYMIYPLCAMGVLGKRLNQVARKTGSITIPDVLRDRFESPALGLFATSTILLFTTSNLVAQFRAGALIVEETFNLPATWGYQLGLILFAVIVVLYTTYGGFRAVVWTDVMQGVVMGAGVLVLLPIVLTEVGGLSQATRRLMEKPPTVVTSLPGPHNDLAFVFQTEATHEKSFSVEYRPSDTVDKPLSVAWEKLTNARRLVFMLPVDAEARARDLRDLMEGRRDLGVSVELAYDNDGSGLLVPMDPVYTVSGEDLVFGPGRHPDGSPFHPLGLALSFFVMWAITSMGQPGMMIRLMAFRDSRTLRRAILIVTVYFALIYLPLVLIFTSARVLIPYLPAESADKAMVLVATRVVGSLGPWHAALAAVFLAAPFAAVMSTVDSFLLMMSSSVVRDIYQRTINPAVSERVTRILSYSTTIVVGTIVTLLASRRIDFLQYIVVFTSSGFASTFLAPIALGIYWKGMTRQGALGAAISGLATIIMFFCPTLWGGERINLLGLHPVVWGLFISFLMGILLSKLSGPPPEHLVRSFFHHNSRSA